MVFDSAQALLVFMTLGIAAAFVLSLLVVGLVSVFLLLRRTRLSRKLQKFARHRAAYRADGQRKRARLAVKCQRKNIKELAVTVSAQLEEHKRKVHPCAYQRATVVVERSVETVDFDRLYALYIVLMHAREKQVPPDLERFFDQENSHVGSGRNWQIHLQDVLHHQE